MDSYKNYTITFFTTIPHKNRHGKCRVGNVQSTCYAYLPIINLAEILMSNILQITVTKVQVSISLFFSRFRLKI